MITINICIGSACHIKGSYDVIHNLQRLIEAHALSSKVELNAVFCINHCMKAVAVKINEGEVYSVSGNSTQEFFENEILTAVMAESSTQ